MTQSRSLNLHGPTRENLNALLDSFHQCRSGARSAGMTVIAAPVDLSSAASASIGSRRREHEIVSVLCSLTRKGSADASRGAGYQRKRTG
jgi:hypothetical protein